MAQCLVSLCVCPEPTEFETTGSVASAVNGVAAKPLESPLARFTRLKMEIKELESDLTALADSTETQKQHALKDAAQDAECDELLRGLATLQSNLSAMALTPSFEPFLRQASPAGVSSVNGDAALALQKQLTSQFFKQIKAIKSQQQGRSGADGGGDAPIVYEIYSNGELNTVEKGAQTRMQLLESRIATLEKTIGSAQAQDFGLDSLSAAMGSSSSSGSNISAVVAQLETRVGLLNEKNLDALKTRTTALVHEFSLMHKLKESPGVQSALNSQADREKIGQIYDKMTRLDDVAASVPALVDRLVTLKSIHDDSLDMTTRVKKMEQSQETLAELLESDAAVLDNVSVMELCWLVVFVGLEI